MGTAAASAAVLPDTVFPTASPPVDDAPIRAIADAFLTTWNEHDMAAFAALYADDADFVNVYGLWWTGRQAIEDAHVATHVSIFRSSTLALTKPHAIRFIAADVALCRTHWSLTGIQTRSGDAAPDRHGRLLHVLKHNGARWQIVATQNTDISPMP